MSEKIKLTQFSGSSSVYDGVLARAIRGLAQDLARLRVNQFSDLTDSSGGTAAYTTGVVLQTGSGVAAFTEAATASAPKAGFDTAIGKTAAAMAVIARYLNSVNSVIGLPLITDSTGGVVATAGTIPAQDLTLTAVNTGCLDVTTGRARLETLKVNMRRLVQAANRVAVAVGETKLAVADGMYYDGSGETIVLDEIAASGTATDGTALSTIADAVVDAELTKIANNIATLALFINDIVGAQLADLTDSTTGTASDTTIEAMAIPAAAVAGAASTSAPKAGFDTELGNIEDGLAELAYHVNWLLRRNNQTGLITDSTGVSVNGTMLAIDTDLTAVDGSSGTNAVDFTTGVARMGTIRNGIATLTDYVNDLCAIYGLPVLTDSSGGTASSTIANITATGTGVGGAASTILDTVADAFLLATANNLASLAARVNAMLNTTNTGANLLTEIGSKVVAWDA